MSKTEKEVFVLQDSDGSIFAIYDDLEMLYQENEAFFNFINYSWENINYGMKDNKMKCYTFTGTSQRQYNVTPKVVATIYRVIAKLTI